MGKQLCAYVQSVGDVSKLSATRVMPKRSNIMWAAVMGAHKAPGRNKQIINGQAPRQTYDDVAASAE